MKTQTTEILNPGDKVTIIDGSYALEIIDCDEDLEVNLEVSNIGWAKNEFIVIRCFHPSSVPDYWPRPVIQSHDNKPIPIHDIVIESCETNKRYLHSSSFIKLVEPKKIVKPLRELINTLIDEGYVPDSDGDWILLDDKGDDTCFCVEMFEYCGKEPDDEFYWKETWLTTKETPVYTGV